MEPPAKRHRYGPCANSQESQAASRGHFNSGRTTAATQINRVTSAVWSMVPLIGDLLVTAISAQNTSQPGCSTASEDGWVADNE
jgi:hypothetical protein